jgi:hypothetical protein
MFIIRVIDKSSSGEACFSRPEADQVLEAYYLALEAANFASERVILETVSCQG